MKKLLTVSALSLATFLVACEKTTNDSSTGEQTQSASVKETSKDKIEPFHLNGDNLGNINCTKQTFLMSKDYAEEGSILRPLADGTYRPLNDFDDLVLKHGEENGSIGSSRTVAALFHKAAEESCEVNDDDNYSLNEVTDSTSNVDTAEDSTPEQQEPKPQTPAITESKAGVFNSENANKVTNGMSLDEVQALIGYGDKGLEMSSAYGTMTSYTWGSIMGGPYLSVTFRNGRVVTKMAMRM